MASVHEVLQHLRNCAVIDHVVLKRWDEETKTAEFFFGIKKTAQDEFERFLAKNGETGLKTFFKKNGLGLFRSLDLPSWVDTEAQLDWRVFGVLGHVALSPRAQRRTKTPSKSATSSRSRDTWQRDRARRRRQEERERRVASGERLRGAGKPGYLQATQTSDPEWAEWEPTSPDAASILRKADASWGRAAKTYEALAQLLNKSGLKPLYGKRFSKSMMPRLVAYVELLRGNDLPSGHDIPAR